MPRCVSRTILVLLVGLLPAVPSHALNPREEPDEWPTLQFSVPKSGKAGQKGAIYRLGSGEVIDTSKKVFRAKPYLPTVLSSPLTIDIIGYGITGIERLPITPETETVLLIDEIYDPNLPYGGITEKPHIIREAPRSGWAQRFLYNLEIERFWQKMNDGEMSDQERELHNSTIGSKYPTIYLMLEPYKFTLPPGKHTIQVLMLDAAGKPINPPITSRYATVIILPPDIKYWPIILSLAGLLLLVALAIAIIKYHHGRPLGG